MSPVCPVTGGPVRGSDGYGSLLCQYRLRGAAEWETHSVYSADPALGGASEWRRQVAPVLRRRYAGGVETRVVSEAETL